MHIVLPPTTIGGTRTSLQITCELTLSTPTTDSHPGRGPTGRLGGLLFKKTPHHIPSLLRWKGPKTSTFQPRQQPNQASCIDHLTLWDPKHISHQIGITQTIHSPFLDHHSVMGRISIPILTAAAIAPPRHNLRGYRCSNTLFRNIPWKNGNPRSRRILTPLSCLQGLLPFLLKTH